METRELRERCWAYALLRTLAGFDFFGHGFARIFTGTHLAGFAHGLAMSMASTLLPGWLSLATGYAIPWIELSLGVLLLLGLGTGFALRLAFCLMFVLMFGITLKGEWSVASEQLVYGLVLFVLLFARTRYGRPWPALFMR